MHNNPLQSNFIVEVDEFKFSKIISSVLLKTCQPMREQKIIITGKSDVCEDEDGREDSCSLSDYDDETELSNNDTQLEIKSSLPTKQLLKEQPEDSSQAHSTSQQQELPFSEIQALFAALDACNYETIGFREFCALVFLLAAMEDNQLLQCLYQHGVLLFDIIGGGQNVITGERSKVLGRTLMGLQEAMIDETCESVLDLTQASLVTYDEFQLMYFEIFKNIQLTGGREIDFEHFEEN